MIAEVASTEMGGSKAAWITDALTTQLPRHFPRVKAPVWFDWNAERMDWVVKSSSAAQQAFAAAIALPYYWGDGLLDVNISPIFIEVNRSGHFAIYDDSCTFRDNVWRHGIRSRCCLSRSRRLFW